MNEDETRPVPFWVTFNPDNQALAGALATLRQGFGRQPGDVPGMWPYYAHLPDSGGLTRRLWAEHLTLSVFALHQQGSRTRVHTADATGRGPSFANALNRLRASGRFSEAALDARVSQAATAPDVHALAYHLRSLISMLKVMPNSAFNYSGLFRDLEDWQYPERVARVRLRWGMDYTHRPTNPANEKE